MAKPKSRSLDPVIIECAPAKSAGLKRYFTGRPCRNGHIAERMVSNGVCLDCQVATNSRGLAADPERFKRYSRETGARFYERHPEVSRLYYVEHKGAMNARSQRWAEENRPKTRASSSAYKKANPHKGAADTGKRRAARLQATPGWLTPDHLSAMEAIYLDAASRPGGPWHVDHIVPLQGKTVCGLHVPWNLQILPALENAAKGNRLIEELALAA